MIDFGEPYVGRGFIAWKRPACWIKGHDFEPWQLSILTQSGFIPYRIALECRRCGKWKEPKA